MEKTSFNIPSVSCSTCAGKIKEGLNGLPGIGAVDVDLKTQTLTVDFDPGKISSTDIGGKVKGMGYEIG